MNPNHTITVATYNICHGRYADFDWQRIAAPIRSVDPDLVGIQEVDMFTRRSGQMDSLRALSDATGLPYALFIPTMDYDGGRYGTAILSRCPILESVSFALPSGELEPRAVGCARVSTADGQEIWLINTHLSYRAPDVVNSQFEAIQVGLRGLIPPCVPAIITGDFNTETLPLPFVGDIHGDVNCDRRYLTFQDPAIAIDHILYTPKTLSLIESGMVESTASDHHLLWGRFEKNA